MSEWRTKTLDQVVELKRGFDLPHAERRPGPYPVLTSGESAGSHDEGPIKGPGFVVGRATNLGVPTWSDTDYWPLNTTLYAADFMGNLPKYLFHLFEILDLAAYDSGSVQPMLNRNYIAKVEVALAPLDQQHAIVEVLGALDDKIAANARLASTADEWVRALFTQLEAGAAECRLLAELAFQPKDLVDPRSVAADTAYVGLEHIPRRMMWLDSNGRAADVMSTKAAFIEGDVLFGKLRPYFHKVVIAPLNGVCSTDVLVMRAIDKRLVGYLLAAASSDAVVERCTAGSEGTRMPRTSWKDLAAVAVPWPGSAEAVAFSERVLELCGLVEARIRESEALASMRDALLPQLMSGKIQVEDAEQIVGDVV
jgi:type I restriction enzyme, S subunit